MLHVVQSSVGSTFVSSVFSLRGHKVTKLSPHDKGNPLVCLRVANGRLHLESNLLIDKHCACKHARSSSGNDNFLLSDSNHC